MAPRDDAAGAIAATERTCKQIECEHSVAVTTFEPSDDNRPAEGPLIAAVRAAQIGSTGTQPARLAVHVSVAGVPRGVVGIVSLAEGQYVREQALAGLEQLQARLVGIRLSSTGTTSLDEFLNGVITDCDFVASDDRPPVWAAAATAIRTALVGVLASATGEAAEGDVAAAGLTPWFPGSWHVADLDEFYDTCLPEIEYYSCAPAPLAHSPEGQMANQYSDGDLIARLPAEATLAHMLEREALSRGMSSIRFPNRTFIVNSGSKRLSFTWGRAPVPSSIQPQISLANDDVREQLANAGVAITADPNERWTHQLAVASGRVAAAIAFTPVVLVGTGDHTVLDLVQHWNRIRSHNPDLRTQLIQVSDGLRKQLANEGHTLGSILKAGQQIELPDYTDTKNVADELHPTVEHAALRVAAVMPGLDFCSVGLNLEDHRTAIADQHATITALDSDVPPASAQYPLWGEPVNIASVFFDACVAARGIRTSAVAKEHLTLKLSIRGRVHSRAYRSWFGRQAQRLGVTGKLTQRRKSTLVARVQGPAAAVSVLVYLAAKGPRRSQPSSVTTKHAWPRWYRSFRVANRRRSLPQRAARRVRGIVRRWSSSR